jgi:hypothetical protein
MSAHRNFSEVSSAIGFLLIFLGFAFLLGVFSTGNYVSNAPVTNELLHGISIGVGLELLGLAFLIFGKK